MPEKPGTYRSPYKELGISAFDVVHRKPRHKKVDNTGVLPRVKEVNALGVKGRKPRPLRSCRCFVAGCDRMRSFHGLCKQCYKENREQQKKER